MFSTQKQLICKCVNAGVLNPILTKTEMYKCFLFNYRYGRYKAGACDKTILQNLVVHIFVHCKSPSSILPLVKDKGKFIRNAQVATSAKICPFVACNS